MQMSLPPLVAFFPPPSPSIPAREAIFVKIRTDRVGAEGSFGGSRDNNKKAEGAGEGCVVRRKDKVAVEAILGESAAPSSEGGDRRREASGWGGRKLGISTLGALRAPSPAKPLLLFCAIFFKFLELFFSAAKDKKNHALG